METQLSTATITARQVVEDYFKALSGNPKTEALIDQWVDDPNLKKHILKTEASFPDYQLVPHQIVAVNATVTAVHKGSFAGIEPTGKSISAGAMMFFRIANSRIAQFWMQADIPAIITQLKG